MPRLQLNQKIAAALLAVGTVTALGLGVAFAVQARLAGGLDALTLEMTSADALADERRGYDIVMRGVNGLMVPRLANVDRAPAYEYVESGLRYIDEASRRWLSAAHPADALALHERSVAAREVWRRTVVATVDACRSRDRLVAAGRSAEDATLRAAEDAVLLAWDGARRSVGPAQQPLDKLSEAMQRRLAEEHASALATAGAVRRWMLAAAAVPVLVLVVVIAALRRSVRTVLGRLQQESSRLRQAIAAGQLSERADLAAIDPEFRPILQGTNEVLEAVLAPFRVCITYFERISHGDVPPRRTNQVQGEIETAQQSVNRCIDAVHALVADAEALAAAAVAGTLSARADLARHEGAFRRVMEGVNATLDAVTKPVEEASHVLERLAARDLTARVGGEFRGEHARIKDAVNSAAEALQASLAQVSQAVAQVSSASSQIAASSQAVASGASEQASALEETSASLQSMASTTRHAADSAQQAEALAGQAKGAAGDGSAAMEEMTSAMGRIKASAEGTSLIIKEVDEIAFQTNLLALNAAVEAARAGEAGRGFAVVAEEVRSLALRAKEAAGKTEALIRQSVTEAGEGEVRARHVSEKLGEIVGSVSKVTDIVAEIAASAKEQAAGIEQVTTAVGQMDQVTQQNAANSEESSSAAAELAGQAQELAAMLASFRLAQDRIADRHAGHVTAAAPALAAPRAAPRRSTIPPWREEVIPLGGHGEPSSRAL